MPNKNLKDILGGGLFALVGLFFLIGAFDYSMGTARAMGPGYFPMLIGGVAVAVGLLIAVPAALIKNGGRKRPARPAWRPLILVLAGILLFGLGMAYVGLIPAVFALVAVSAFADNDARPVPTLLLAAVTTAGIWFVFHVLLGISAPLFIGLV